LDGVGGAGTWDWLEYNRKKLAISFDGDPEVRGGRREEEALVRGGVFVDLIVPRCKHGADLNKALFLP
jgi:hypothetical protein